MNAESGYAEVNGTKLYYEIKGKGHPLVLVHGFTLDNRMWDDQFQEFSKHYRVLRYDLRGYGKSAMPSGQEYTDSDDLMCLMKYLDIEHAHIIGLSMGGCIASDFTLSYPRAVDKLVLADTTLNGYTWTEEYGSSLRSIWVTCKERGVEAAKAQFLDFEIFCSESENPKVYSALKRIIDDYSFIHFLYDIPECRIKMKPVAQRLHDIHAPTLVIVGERDSPDFHIIADLLIREIPQARKLIISRVKHMSNMEDPETFNKEVLSFLASPSTTSQSQ